MQQLRDEVMLEFLADGGGEKDDALMEMSFYVPRENQQYPGDEERPPSKASVLMLSLNLLTRKP